MLDYEKIANTLQVQLGAGRYANNVVYIAELLAELDPKTTPELNYDGAEEWVIKRIVKQIEGVRAIQKVADVYVRDISPLTETIVSEQRTTINGIREYVNFNTNKKDRQYSARDRLAKISTIREALKNHPELYLTKIHSGKGKQTANDWLSDIMGAYGLDKDSKFMRNMVDEIRNISKRNVKQNKKMTKIRDFVTHEDLTTLSPHQIWDKYDFETKLAQKYDARFRVRIRRLRKEVISG